MQENEYRRSVPVAAPTPRGPSAAIRPTWWCSMPARRPRAPGPGWPGAGARGYPPPWWPCSGPSRIAPHLLQPLVLRAWLRAKRWRMPGRGAHGRALGPRRPRDWAFPGVFLRSLSGPVGRPGSRRRQRGPGRRAVDRGRPARGGGARAGSLRPRRRPTLSLAPAGRCCPPPARSLIVDRPELRRALRIAGQPSDHQVHRLSQRPADGQDHAALPPERTAA